MHWYVRGPRGAVKHLQVWANDEVEPGVAVIVPGRPVPVCGQDRGKPWRYVREVDAVHLPLCSRCLTELDKLNEAASHG